MEKHFYLIQDAEHGIFTGFALPVGNGHLGEPRWGTEKPAGDPCYMRYFSKHEAIEVLAKIHRRGFPRAYVTTHEFELEFT